MPKLSRRGWNNVLIFCCLAFILIFSRVGQENTGPTTYYLLPENAHILSWESPTWRIERIGTTWRSQPDLGILASELGTLINRWQSLSLDPSAPLRGQPQILRVWIVDSDTPINLLLYQENGSYAIQTGAATG